MAVGGFDFLMWFKLMDEPEIWGLSVDSCVCVEFKVWAKESFFSPCFLLIMCRCKRASLHVSMCAHFYFDVGSRRLDTMKWLMVQPHTDFYPVSKSAAAKMRCCLSMR